MQFYPDDWLRDTARLSTETRGIWIMLICLMWSHNPRGSIFGTREELSRATGCLTEEFDRFLRENQRFNFADVTEVAGTVTIYSRRMIREEKLRNGNAERQKRFRDHGGGSPERWTAIRVAILERDNYDCGYCPRKARTVDHVLPRSLGGTEDDWNLVACCKVCNSFKSNRTLDQAGLALRPEVAARLETLKSAQSVDNSGRNSGRNGSKTDEIPDPEARDRSLFPDLSRDPDRTLSKNGDRSGSPDSKIARATPEEIAALWNATGALPAVRLPLGAAIRRWTLDRLRDRPALDDWREIIERVAKSRYCRGEVPGKEWRATFGWLVERKGAVDKVLDGRYDDSKSRPKESPIEIAKRRMREAAERAK